MLRKRAPTRSVRKTGLHPLDRYNERIKGHFTRFDIGVSYTIPPGVKFFCTGGYLSPPA